MLTRRDMLRLIPASSLALGVTHRAQAALKEEPAPSPLLAGPPVVQHLTSDGFAVSFAVGQLTTGWVEWGWSAKQLDRRAVASRAGLIEASDRALVVPVELGEQGKPGTRLYYRVVAQSLQYETAYKLHRGEPVAGDVERLVLPDPAAAQVRVIAINDTHDNRKTVETLAARIEAIGPEVLAWNGDTIDAYNSPADLPRVLLKQGWARTRPLLFVPGNHDTRGASAREIRNCMAAGPDASLPYNVARRHGPLALLTLDTGEDKPDAHPVFGGTAAFEPYRARQAVWLREALRRPEIASAPFKVAFCHIPLRGRPRENDGLSLNGFAAWSGAGAKAWLPALREGGVRLVVSGHTHAWRVDDPTDQLPMQVIGGGPEESRATVIVLEADAQSLRVVIQDLAGTELAQRRLTRV